MIKKRLWIIGTIVLLILAGVLLWGTLNEVSKFKPHHNTKNDFQVNSEELIGLTMKIPGVNRNGYWEINCAKLINNKDFGDLTNVTGQYYSAGKSIYHMVADSGRIIWKNSDFKLIKNVKLSDNNGRVLSAEMIKWSPKYDKIIARRNVHLTTQSMEAAAEHIITKSGLDKVVFKGMTKVTFKDLSGK